MPSADLSFGIDISVYDGKVNWDVVATHINPQVVFTGIRATVSWGYTDAQFPRNWSEAKSVSAARVARGGFPLFRCAYHVVYPSEDAVRQIDYFMTVVGPDLGELPLVLDVELDQALATALALIKCWLALRNSPGKPAGFQIFTAGHYGWMNLSPVPRMVN